MKQKIFFLSLSLFSLFFLSACGQKDTPITSTQAPQVTEATSPDESSFSGSVKDLLALGKNLKCTWTFENEQSQMAGTVYVSGTKSRTDMLVNAPQTENLTTHFISDGQTAYSWTDGQPQGYMFKINPDDQNTPDPENQQYRDWQNEYEYKCDTWSLDNSLFQIPQDIKFVDLNQQMQELKSNMGGICDQLPSPQKEECLNSLE
jgi:hypothetical protein